MNTVVIDGLELRVFDRVNVVVGSGAAGLNCADLLARGGAEVCVVTEGMNMGTSRNTGSDKQTYYKLTMTGGTPDSVRDMAALLFEGGSMRGDIALCEAANSPRAFIRLCELGVPFPVNEYGEYVGYRTDHDDRKRATSCGPLTSFYMTEALEKSVRSRDIEIFDGFRVCEIVSDGEKVAGIICVSADGWSYIRCSNLVWAVGGPSAVYFNSVYPQSQTCALGAAFIAGCDGVNLTESQYGIASVGFRWNLSGSYQQVVPRYFSRGADGVERELELDFNKIFLKGYQWPFDPRRLNGSSDIDMAVYRENSLGRRVFMDFTRDPKGFSPEALSDEARQYLQNSGALQHTPFERLKAMNPPAVELYRSHGYDLSSEPLEIGVCAQHCNGGLYIDADYRTSLPGMYAVGECAGVFGVRRPGGSALNSTQVSSMRAAAAILADTGRERSAFIPLHIASSRFFAPSALTLDNIIKHRREYGERMDCAGAFIRDGEKVAAALAAVKADISSFDYRSDDLALIREISINYDILITQLMFLSAIDIYIKDGGGSRGSYLINGDPAPDTLHFTKQCRVSLNGLETSAVWEDVFPPPESEQWFEKIYANQKRGK